LFSEEIMVLAGQIGLDEDPAESDASPFELMQNRPNPFDESTWIGVHVAANQSKTKGELAITDLGGRLIELIPITLEPGMNEVLYRHGYGQVGTFQYTLRVEGQSVGSKRMIFAN
jgi:hypothetical protein